MLYCDNLTSALNKIKSFFNADIYSESYGSFDRYFWGWKKKDFQDATLAYAIIPLLKGYNYLQKELEDYYMEGCINNILKMQYEDGSFEQSYPNELHPKTGLSLSEVLAQKLQIDNSTKITLAYKRLMDFSMSGRETYGNVTNHLVHHMYEYLLAWKFLKDEKYYNFAREILLEITTLTNNEEGWHQEYLSADAGYQTRALKYLVKCLHLFRKEEYDQCLALAILNVSFLDRLILPDGTLYAMFGSRNTALIYPSGIEYMAFLYPERFGSLCQKVRNAIENGRAILPLHLEFDNFNRLLDDFLDAQKYYDMSSKKYMIQEQENFDMMSFGFKMIKQGQYQIYIQYKFGGAIAVYKNDSCILRNAGLLFFDENKEIFLGTRNLNIFSESEILPSEIHIKTFLFQPRLEDLTPVKLVALRILNLTFLRIRILADAFRILLVNRLITPSNNNHNYITRIIKWEKGILKIIDKWEIKFQPSKIWNMRNLNLFHMASSRYNNPVEIGSNNVSLENKYCTSKGEYSQEINMI